MMRKSVKIMIGLMMIICVLGVFTTSGKSQELMLDFKPYSNYSISNAYLIAEPIESNNYRFEFYKEYYDSNDVYLSNDKPTTNTKYGISQYYYNFDGNYDDDSNFKIGLTIITLSNIGSTNYKQYTHIWSNDTHIDFGYYGYLDTGTGYTMIFGSYTEPAFIDSFIFDDYNITLDSIKTIEIDFQYRISSDKDIYVNFNVLINNTLLKTINFLCYENSYSFTYIYNSETFIYHELTKYLMINGMRVMYLDMDDYMNGFFIIPSFLNEIFTLPDDEVDYDDGEFWYYISYQLTEANLERIEFSETIDFQGTNTEQEFVYDFQMTEGLLYNAKFYYTSIIVKAKDMGDWSWAWNWLRDGIAWVCNALLIALQFLLYLLVAGISILFGWLFIAIIIPFVWNVLLFWIIFGAVYLIFYVWIGLIILFDWIIDILIPLFQWIVIEALPVIIEGLIYIISWIFALLFYLISLGTGDLIQLQAVIQQFLNVIADFFISSMTFIVKYMPEILTYVLFYFILIGFCYLKITYTNARGFVNRSNQLQASLSAYMMPVKLGYNVLENVKSLIVMWW